MPAASVHAAAATTASNCLPDLNHNAAEIQTFSDTAAEDEELAGSPFQCKEMAISGEATDVSDYVVQVPYVRNSGSRNNRIDLVVAPGLTTGYDTYEAYVEHVLSRYADRVYTVWILGHPGIDGSDFFTWNYMDPSSWLYGNAEIGEVNVAHVADAYLQELAQIKADGGLAPGQIYLEGWSAGGQMTTVMADMALARGTSLYANFGVKDVLLEGAVPPNPVDWMSKATEYADLLTGTLLATEPWPTGAIAEADKPNEWWCLWMLDSQVSADWPGSLCGEGGDDWPVYTTDNFPDKDQAEEWYGSASGADAAIRTMNSREPWDYATSVLGLAGGIRPTVDSGVLPASTYEVTGAYFTHDPYVVKSDIEAIYTYVTGASAANAPIYGVGSSHAGWLLDPTIKDAVMDEFLATVSVPKVGIDDTAVTEGNSATTTAQARVRLSSPPTQPVTVTYQTYTGTAVTGDDFVSKSGQVVFNPGETTKYLSFAVIGDTAFEKDEIFDVVVSAIGAPVADGTAMVTILNDDGGGSIRVVDSAVDEPAAGSTSTYAQVKVTFSAPNCSRTRVWYRTVAGTATAGDDFASNSGRFTFEPNCSGTAPREQYVPVEIKPDNPDDPGDETFSLEVFGNPLITTSTGTVTIHDAP